MQAACIQENPLGREIADLLIAVNRLLTGSQTISPVSVGGEMPAMLQHFRWAAMFLCGEESRAGNISRAGGK